MVIYKQFQQITPPSCLLVHVISLEAIQAISFWTGRQNYINQFPLPPTFPSLFIQPTQVYVRKFTILWYITLSTCRASTRSIFQTQHSRHAQWCPRHSKYQTATENVRARYLQEETEIFRLSKMKILWSISSFIRFDLTERRTVKNFERSNPSTTGDFDGSIGNWTVCCLALTLISHMLTDFRNSSVYFAGDRKTANVVWWVIPSPKAILIWPMLSCS